MRPWMPRRRLALATKCTICQSPTCDRKAATDAKNSAYDALATGRTDRNGLYDAFILACASYITAAARCAEPSRQLAIFNDAMIETSAKRLAFDRAISEGVRQSMQPKQCGATMLCMRGAR